MKKKKLKLFKKKHVNIDKKINFNKLFIRVFVTLNNTIITVVNDLGKSVFWVTSCTTGLKGAKKSTAYSSQMAGEIAGRYVIKHGVKDIDLLIKGLGPGRDSSVKGVFYSGVKISSISDVTPIPHNGCKPRKLKRI